jgi:uncharacterized protein DUF4270
MTTKVVNVLKYVGLSLTVFFTIISCEKEIESIGVNLVDNNNFSTNKLTIDIVTANKNVERVISNGVPQYLLGVYSDTEFGKLKASIISQLSLPASGEEYNYGTNALIDSVLINIPYQSTREGDESDGKPMFSIDSVIGDKNAEFQLSVYELKTFLNTLDPNDPSKSAVYYSDKEFQKNETPLFSGNFKINPNDTVSYIKRYMPDAITVFDIDTVKQSDLSPSIRIPLNENLIQQLFIDNAANSEFSSSDDFQHYFRGLYIEADELANAKSHLISLDIAKAQMIIYYSNDEDEAEGQDLNGNGTNGEQGVRVKQKYEFSFGAIKSNILDRDNTIAKASGEDRLYVQGAAGSMATIDLSIENLEDLRENNWLITDTNLIFYVDQNASSDIAPKQLFLYNYDENLQILDMMTEGLAAVGGLLERDEDGKPYRYVFKITDYISELLKSDEPLDLVKLGLKVYGSSDLPVSISDTAIKDFSWNPKGVVLYGDDVSAGDKRIKFEIFYSQLNN